MFALPVELIFNPLILPVALIVAPVIAPAVVIFPPVILPVATTCPAVIKLPPLTFPVVTCDPDDIKLPPDMLAVVVILPIASINTVFMEANLSVAFPKFLVLFVSGSTLDPNDPLMISWSPMVTSCVIERLLAIVRSPLIVALPVKAVVLPAKVTTLALPATEIVTLALFATAIFDVPLVIAVGVIVELYNSLKLSLHFI